MKGLRKECEGAQDYDLVLRLDLAGANFHHIPFYLYAWRVHSQSTASSIQAKPYVVEAAKKALQDYFKEKKLDWEVVDGYIPTSYRAIPKLTKKYAIHVIILYKDLKKLTLACVKSVLRQQGVTVKITAVDNNSEDHSIAAELNAMGCEVLSIKEPFNFSRLNNLAVQKTKIGQDCELVLFLNNDVELDEGALEEMTRWIAQPGVGIVGCRLNYPNGKLQHGGIDFNENRPSHQMQWEHTEKGLNFNHLHFGRLIRVADAVTAACALMRRELFIEIGGFDEIWYPITYSDTALTLKLQSKNLWSLYTPYAVGVHHESVSRSYANIEDYEMSRWLHEKYQTTILNNR